MDEDVVRTALRENSAPITQDPLRHTAAGRRKGRSAVLVAVAFVLAAGGITTAITLGGAGQQSGVQAGTPAYAGFRWHLRKVDDHDVPAEVGASVSFLSGGDFRLSDGINAAFGRYDAMDELTSQEAGIALSGDRLVITTASHEMVLSRGETATRAVPSSR